MAARKKKKTRASVSYDNRDWIIQNHAKLLGKTHNELEAEGFSFEQKKTRFWVRKDNGISVRFIYSKKGPLWVEEQAILTRLTVKQQTLFCNCNNIETKLVVKI